MPKGGSYGVHAADFRDVVVRLQISSLQEEKNPKKFFALSFKYSYFQLSNICKTAVREAMAVCRQKLLSAEAEMQEDLGPLQGNKRRKQKQTQLPVQPSARPC